MINSLIWLPITVISANIFLLLKKKNYINYVIGIFIIWPLLFLLTSYFTNDYKFVIALYIISTITGLFVIIKNKLWVSTVIIFIIVLSVNYVFSFQSKNYRGDLDSKHYTYSAARINYNEWGNVCDNKIIESKLINDLAKYTRLPILAYTWTNNIYQLPIKNDQIYGLSLFYTSFCIFFLSLILKIKLSLTKFPRIIKIILLLIMSSAIYGGYSLLSSFNGQINQSYALLISTITIYLSLTKSFNYILKIILPILIFFAFPEFFPAYLIYLSFTFLVENKSIKDFPKNLTMYFLSLFPLFLLIVMNLQYYIWYFNNQLHATPGWWPIVNYDKNIWLTYFLIENPNINNHLLIISALFSIIIASIKSISNNIKIKSNLIYYLFILLIIFASYVLINIVPNSNYASFKLAGWFFPLIAISILFIPDKFKLCFYFLIFLCIFRLANFSQTYVAIIRNKSFLKINYSSLNKNVRPNKLQLNNNKIDQMLSAANYNCPAKNCSCENKDTYSTKYR